MSKIITAVALTFFISCSLLTSFVYADPPYDVEFTAYSAGGFGWEDQVRTATVLTRHPGPVVLVTTRDGERKGRKGQGRR